MRTDAAAYPNEDIERSVLIELWATATPSEIIAGTATGEFDVSPFVARARQTESKLTLELRYNTAFLNCDAQPQPGQLLTVKTDGTLRFSGVIESINSRASSGLPASKAATPNALKGNMDSLSPIIAIIANRHRGAEAQRRRVFEKIGQPMFLLCAFVPLPLYAYLSSYF